MNTTPYEATNHVRNCYLNLPFSSTFPSPLKYPLVLYHQVILMIDPTSIASASAALVGACGKISQYIYTFLNKMNPVDTVIPVLKIEIDALAGVLGSISVKFSDTSTATTALQSLTGYEEEYWRHVKRSMTDCGMTLRTLEEVLRSIKQADRPFMRRTTVQMRLEQKSIEVELLKQQISFYHKTMELSLHLITVYFPRYTELTLVPRSYETKT